MRKRIPWFVIAFLFIPAYLACDSDESNGNGGANDGIAGIVTYMDGETPVINAVITMTSNEGTYTTTSGPDGRFHQTGVTDGEYTVTADKGAFHAESGITVYGGKSGGDLSLFLELPAVSIGVVPGSFDDIGSILTGLGYSYTGLDDSDLTSWANLEPLEMLFLSCGSDYTMANDAAVQDNLDRFVNEGGYLYVSDWNYQYVEQVWPEAIDFYISGLGESRVGMGNQTVTANIKDEIMASYLGKDTAEIVFDKSGWVVIDSVPAETDILVSGDFSTSDGAMTDKPLMVSFTYGSGIVGYTSFHNEAQLGSDPKNILLYFISLTPPTE